MIWPNAMPVITQPFAQPRGHLRDCLSKGREASFLPQLPDPGGAIDLALPLAHLDRPGLLDALRDAGHQIESQRRIIEALSPRAQAYDTIVKILGLVPGEPMAMGEDIAWKIRNILDRADVHIEHAMKQQAEKEGAEVPTRQGRSDVADASIDDRDLRGKPANPTTWKAPL